MHEKMRKLAKHLLRSTSQWLGQQPAARNLFFYVARDFTPTLVGGVGAYRYHVSTSDRTVAREVFLTGGFDNACIKHIFDVLAEVGFSDFKGKLFLDIGANIGTTSVPVVVERGFAGGIAIEPEPANFALLSRNVAENDLENKIRCIRAALSDEVGRAEMELCPVNLGDHRLRPHNGIFQDGIYHESGRKTVTVATMTFDALVVSGTLSPSSLGVVWIDTQGHEGHVLKGASKLVESQVPVVVEFWPYALERAGGLDLFFQIATGCYAHFIDLRATAESAHAALQPISSLPALINLYTGPGLTDLLLLK